MSDVEILESPLEIPLRHQDLDNGMWLKFDEHTFMPSSEKHGGTAEDSSSASDSKIGNFSTADMGMSPR